MNGNVTKSLADLDRRLRRVEIILYALIALGGAGLLQGCGPLDFQAAGARVQSWAAPARVVADTAAPGAGDGAYGLLVGIGTVLAGIGALWARLKAGRAHNAADNAGELARMVERDADEALSAAKAAHERIGKRKAEIATLKEPKT